MIGLGGGLGILGDLLNIGASGLENLDMKNVTQNEFGLQQSLQNQAWNAFVPSLAGRSAESAQQQIGQGAQSRLGWMNQLNQPLTNTSGVGQAGDSARLGLQNNAAAKLGGYSDWQLQQMINNIRTNQALQKISSFARGDASVFPYKLDDAQHSWDPLSFAGNLLSGAGMGLGTRMGQFGSGGGNPYAGTGFAAGTPLNDLVGTNIG